MLNDDAQSMKFVSYKSKLLHLTYAKAQVESSRLPVVAHFEYYPYIDRQRSAGFPTRVTDAKVRPPIATVNGATPCLTCFRRPFARQLKHYQCDIGS